MTTTLEARIAELEAIVFAPPRPSTQAATDGYGNPGTVVAGELVESAWGNAVRDHVVRVFPDFAALSTWAAPNGALAEAPAGTFYIRFNAQWLPFGAGLIGFQESFANSGPYALDTWGDIPAMSINFIGVANRYYRVSLHVPGAVQNGENGAPTIGVTGGDDTILNTARYTALDGQNHSLSTSAIFQWAGPGIVKGKMQQDSFGTASIVIPQAGGRVLLTLEVLGLAF